MKAIKFREEKARGSGGYPGKMGPCAAYRLEPPLINIDWDDSEESHEYIFVSQAAPLFMWETYIFAADENGEVNNWGELDGSRKGYITPDDLLRELGYEVVDNVPA